MVTDWGGNSLKQAKFLGFVSGSISRSDWVGKADRNDIYKFNLDTISNLQVSLGRLKASTSLSLLNSTGQTIQKFSAKRGQLALNRVLVADTYFIQVKSRDRLGTRYRLNLAASPQTLSEIPNESESPKYFPGSPTLNLNKSSLTEGESLSVTGTVQDLNGALDISRIDFWLTDASNNRIELPDAFTFTPIASNEAQFSYPLIPSGYTPGNYSLWATAYDRSGSASSSSSQSFTIISPTAPVPPSSITITSPNGGESLLVGNTYTITWQDNIAETVKIDLFQDGILSKTLFESIESDGIEIWTVPSDLASGNSYQIRISSTTNSSLFDDSDSYFSLAAPDSSQLDSYQYYTFKYNYGSGEYYQGYGYVDSEPYTTGQILFDGNVNETGYFGSYEILSAETYSGETLHSNKIWVTSYYDSESQQTRFFSALSGSNGLSSEYGDLISGNSLTQFGGRYYEADLPISQYAFTYYYDPAQSTKDYYTGFVYAYDGTYIVSTYHDHSTNNNEIGTNGKYFINSAVTASNSSDLGKVFINSYYDVDSRNSSFVPVKYSQGIYSGSNYLGSEIDYIGNYNNNYDSFGGDSAEADGVFFYNFTYYYNGNSSSSQDYYTGGVYAPAGTYAVGSYFDSYTSPNETGFNGRYWISSYSVAGTSSDLGRVYLNSYYNSENNTSYTPDGYGTSYLGSEFGYLTSTHSLDERFGSDYEEADVAIAPYLTLVTPNGGNSLIPGNSTIITWNDNISENVKIDLYKGGNYYSTLFSSTLSDGSENWTVPTTLPSGSDYKIRISGTTNTALYDESNAYFTIPPYLTLVTPNGGNSLTPGNSTTITWNDNISENVKIDLYKGGTYHSTLFSSTLSDGSENWTVPTTLPSGNDYKIRVSSVTSGSLFDESNAYFSISEPPSNGFDIKFDYRFDTNNWFTPEKRAALESAASVWKNIILDEFTDIPIGTSLRVSNPQTGATSTFVSDTVIDDLLIFVGARDLGSGTLGLGGPSATWIVGSDLETRYTGNDFSPWTGSIAFNSNAGTNWFFDSTPATANDIPFSNYDFISVAVHEMGHILGIGTSNAYKNLVVNGTFVGSNAVANNGGNPVPLEYSLATDTYPHVQSGYPVTGEAAMDPSLTNGVRKLPTVLDIALLDDIGYSVNYPVSPFIAVSAPTGGTTLTQGSNYTIAWTDNISENVKIDLYKGGSFHSSIATSTASDGTETWTIPSNLPAGSDYQIRIASVSNSTVYDLSDNYFTISAPAYITVTNPNGGDTLSAGSTYVINWTDNISENVKIDLFKGGSFYSPIVSSTASTGSYSWTVPSISGTDYQIRVSSATSGTVYDISNSNFTIRADLKRYLFHYDYNPTVNYTQADSYTGYVIAPAGSYPVSLPTGSFVESNYDFYSTNTEIGINGKYWIYQIDEFDDNLVGESGKVYLHNYVDRDNGSEQNFIPYKYTIGQPSGTNYLGSELDYIDATQSTQTQFGQEFYEADPEATNWKAEFFNNKTLTGTSPFIDSFGSGLLFDRQWGLNSPSERNNPATILADGFSARISSNRYLAPGLYQIKTSSDDGVRVIVDGLRVIDAWYDQGNTLPHSGFFKWSGGTAPITVEYYDNTGGAAIKFELKSATSFTDANLDATTRWLTNVFTWNPNQGTAPPLNFFEDNGSKIGTIDQGSNTRTDGKKGISFNLGKGALLNDPARLPDDRFVVRSYTWADFDNSLYKLHVSGDDGYQILAKNQNTNQWYYITPHNEWQYGTKDIQFSLPAGRYDLHFHYFENGGDATFDLSWEKASNPDITINLDFFGNFTQTQKDLINKAADNWRKIITKDMVPEGVLNIAVTEGSTQTDGSVWLDNLGKPIWATTGFPVDVYGYGQKPSTPVRYNSYTSYDNQIGRDYHTRMHFNSLKLADSSWVNSYLVRLATHELGHALYLDDAQSDSLLTLDGIMDLKGLDSSMTEGIYQRLEYFGYSVDRNASVLWY